MPLNVRNTNAKAPSKPVATNVTRRSFWKFCEETWDRTSSAKATIWRRPNTPKIIPSKEYNWLLRNALTQSAHVFTSADGLEADERYLHTRESTNGVPGAVGNVETVREPAHEDKNKSMDGNHVCNEDIST